MSFTIAFAIDASFVPLVFTMLRGLLSIKITPVAPPEASIIFVDSML